mmetsp:Transcript_43578/g.79365  ORF Transcript_43578/g.79365 Transcript_43578/m.79365 type:complete len:896 (+) Transcript_43578:80-2767(+)
MAADIPEVGNAAAPLAADGEGEDLRERMEKESLQRVKHVDIGRGVLAVKMNPVVTVVSALVIWTFIACVIAMPDRMNQALNIAAFDWTPRVWSWFYVITQDLMIVVLLYVVFISKYANLKFGKEDEEPEFSFATWFSMLFSAGVGIGLFYYGVAEPLWHAEGDGDPRWSRHLKGYGNANEDAIHGMMVTWYHWGIHGWVAYTTGGAVLGLLTHRRGYPLTTRYFLWPLIGEKVYGVIGDCVDILSIVTTLFGVCTSLGLGAMQVNQGLQRLNHGFYRGTSFSVSDEAKYADPTCDGHGSICEEGQESYGIQTNVTTQIMIISVITIMATLSVVSGIGQGIKNLSRLTFALGMFLLLVILFMGETYFCLDVIVQTIGYYMFYFFKIGFQTDAFERLGSKEMGLGGAPDDLGGGSTWLNNWTIFYWGWWMSWTPFVGTFLARISRGRTLRQFIVGTTVIPTIYAFIWFGTFGSEGLRMQRLAAGSGLCDVAYAGDTSLCTGGPDSAGSHISDKCNAYSAQYSEEYKRQVGMGWNPPCVLDPDYHDGFGRCNTFGWERYVVVADVCTRSTVWVDVPCGAAVDPTNGSVATSGPCAGKGSSSDYNHFPAESQPGCFVPLQDGVVCLFNQGTTDIFFDLLAAYAPQGFSDLMSVIAMIALVLYFVTSSDSGSFVIDMIAANGIKDPPLLQRIFWSVTEGATACALLASGRNRPEVDGSLVALQSCSLMAGLPYTFVLLWCSQALVILCKEESGEITRDRKGFSTFIFDLYPVQILKNTFVPGLVIGRVIGQVGGWPQVLPRMSAEVNGMVWGGILQVQYLLAFALCWMDLVIYAWLIVGLVLYIGFGTMCGLLRTQVREAHGIQHGDLITDQVCGILVMPFTLTQMENQLDSGKLGTKSA